MCCASQYTVLRLALSHSSCMPSRAGTLVLCVVSGYVLCFAVGGAEAHIVALKLHAFKEAGSAGLQPLQLALFSMLPTSQQLQLCNPASEHLGLRV